MKHFGDITKLSGYTLPVVDVITGGSPCQDLSVAGKRRGLDGERSGLFMEQIRIVKEMRKKDGSTGRSGFLVRPRYCVWENVPGAFISNGGKDFQSVLTEFARIAEPDAPDVPLPEKGRWSKSGCIYAEMGGWSIAWRVHDAQFWGVPQRRKRIALIADFGGLSAPEILFERKGLSGDSKSGETQGKEATAAFGRSTKGAICYGISGYYSNSMKSLNPDSGIYEASTSRTLDLNGGSPACNQGGMMIVESDFTFSMQAFGAYKESNVASSLKMRDHKDATDLVASVDCRNFTENAEINGTLQAKENGGTSLNLNNVCRSGSIVRRLTPLECERLQGFPDRWTDIGDWEDSKGKIRKAADSQRYKALGNSIALPFWQYLARRICAQYERNISIGSLFDGIGGFPLVFERCGAKAVWASEIEEFPIAVTKKHFPE